MINIFKSLGIFIYPFQIFIIYFRSHFINFLLVYITILTCVYVYVFVLHLKKRLNSRLEIICGIFFFFFDWIFFNSLVCFTFIFYYKAFFHRLSIFMMRDSFCPMVSSSRFSFIIYNIHTYKYKYIKKYTQFFISFTLFLLLKNSVIYPQLITATKCNTKSLQHKIQPTFNKINKTQIFFS